MSRIIGGYEPDRQSRYWYSNGWWGDQGMTAQCVGYAWSHWLEDGPVTHRGPAPVVPPEAVYNMARSRDEWDGEDYEGTSIRAGAKALQELGLIASYWWAQSLDDIRRALLDAGPMVVGVMWYEGMDEPDERGIIAPTGAALGGHAFKLDGYSVKTGLIRMKNSWGRAWGRNGFAYLRDEDLGRLVFAEDGEACLAIETPPGAWSRPVIA